MSDVTIGTDTFTIYSTMADINTYINGMMSSEAARWNASADTDKKARAAVMATRLFDRQRYVDEANTFALRDAIPAFADAVAEMALAIFTNPSLYTQETSGKNVKRVDAGGGVGVEFFLPTLGITGRFPVQVQELIGEYLEGSEVVQGSSGSFSSGADGTSTSVFDDDVDFNLNGPLS